MTSVALMGLVFEDDAELAPQFLERLLALMVRCPASYDLLYVGASCNPQMGNFDNTRIDVATADELVKAVGPEIVCSVHDAITNGHVFTQMAAHLRQLSGGGH